MASEARDTAHRLNQRLSARPFDFDFFAAVRAIECARRDLPRIGYSRHAREDPVRFGQEPDLSFAPASISALKDGAPGAAPRLLQRFFGLLGPNGPLPHHITEFVRDRQRNHADPTAARFFDVLNHRMLSLFYRAWAANQKAASHDRPDEDRFAFYIACLFGLGPDSFRRRDSVPDLAKLRFSGHLAGQARHPSGLESVLSDFFGVPVQIQECVGQWVRLPEHSLCRLGDSPRTGSLGSTAVVGSSVWDCQQKFRIRAGPMHFADLERLLPGSRGLRRLADWVRLYTCDEFTYDLQLVLLAPEVPQVCLGRSGRLGWTTWVRSVPFTADADQIVLRPSA